MARPARDIHGPLVGAHPQQLQPQLEELTAERDAALAETSRARSRGRSRSLKRKAREKERDAAAAQAREEDGKNLEKLETQLRVEQQAFAEAVRTGENGAQDAASVRALAELAERVNSAKRQRCG